jgi:hypothetical protein
MPRFHPRRIFKKYKQLRSSLGLSTLTANLNAIAVVFPFALKEIVWNYEYLKNIFDIRAANSATFDANVSAIIAEFEVTLREAIWFYETLVLLLP